MKFDDWYVGNSANSQFETAVDSDAKKGFQQIVKDCEAHNFQLNAWGVNFYKKKS